MQPPRGPRRQAHLAGEPTRPRAGAGREGVSDRLWGRPPGGNKPLGWLGRWRGRGCLAPQGLTEAEAGPRRTCPAPRCSWRHVQGRGPVRGRGEVCLHPFSRLFAVRRPRRLGRVGTHVGAGGHSGTRAHLPRRHLCRRISHAHLPQARPHLHAPPGPAGPWGTAGSRASLPPGTAHASCGHVGLHPPLPPKPAHAHSPLLGVQPARDPSTRVARGRPLLPNDPPDRSLPGSCGAQRRPFTGRAIKANGHWFL